MGEIQLLTIGTNCHKYSSMKFIIPEKIVRIFLNLGVFMRHHLGDMIEDKLYFK